MEEELELELELELESESGDEAVEEYEYGSEDYLIAVERVAANKKSSEATEEQFL